MLGNRRYVILFSLIITSIDLYGYLRHENTAPTALQTYQGGPDKLPAVSNVNTYKSLWEISNNLKHYWLFFRAGVVQNESHNHMKYIDDGYVALNSNLMRIIQMSATERKQKLDQMSLFIQERIRKAQHPSNCLKVKLLLCDVDDCGFGCCLRSVINCLLQAFVTGRTAVFRSKGWIYTDQGWTYAFLPLSNCTDNRIPNSVPELSDDVENLKLRVVKMKYQVERWSEWSVPIKFESELKRLHGHPFAWWISQFTTYAMRPQPWLQTEFKNAKKRINFTSSVVGMQVRWGDKLRVEAIKHNVSEYMNFIERWYEQLEHQGKQVDRTVYLATEAVQALTELQMKYPNYKFIGNQLRSTKITKKSRYREEGLKSVILDILFLSECDYLVCTISSGVCQASYELMMNVHPDASLRFQSLDDGFRLMESSRYPAVAIMDHDPVFEGEIQLRKGDEIYVRMNPNHLTNDGFLRGKNRRTKKKGKFPYFKITKQLSSYSISRLNS